MLAFSSERASFSIKFMDHTLPYRIMAIYVLPDENVKLEVEKHKGIKGNFDLKYTVGNVTQSDEHNWSWKAPTKPGLYHLTIIHPEKTDSIKLNIFVMIPFNSLKGEYLNGYRIGNYPSFPLKNLPIYKPPKGFIEITPENEETYISPHFQIRQFLSKQEGDYPKYLVLRARLILKLELILEKINESGISCNTLYIMSGYRTPSYNRAIGNVKYSRHVWGGAADVFIDENPKDGNMDDLNKDGKIDYRDAAVLYKIIDDMYGNHWYEIFLGGLARYKRTKSHGPFVHVDVRGFRIKNYN
jgi:hypothetical protein